MKTLYSLLLSIPHFDILGDDGSLYLRRFFLLGGSSSGSTPVRGGWWQRLTNRLPFRLYLHEIRRSDNDRCPQNHPWWFWSLILAGGYSEALYDRRDDGLRVLRDYYERRPGSLRYCPASTIHRVRLDMRWTREMRVKWDKDRFLIERTITRDHNLPDRTAWTLVLAGPNVQEWGFFTRSGWVQWREFLGKSKDARDAEC